jgi:hypothetical protein
VAASSHRRQPLRSLPLSVLSIFQAENWGERLPLLRDFPLAVTQGRLMERRIEKCVTLKSLEVFNPYSCSRNDASSEHQARFGQEVVPATTQFRIKKVVAEQPR